MTIRTDILQALKTFSSEIVMYDAEGRETVDLDLTTRFVIQPTDIVISLRDQDLVVSKPSVVTLDQFEPLLKRLRGIATAPQYDLTFKVKNIGQGIQNKDAKNMKQGLDQIAESLLGKLYGRMRTSYQTVGESKIIYKHRKPVNEQNSSSRTRNIKSITIESAGVKYEYPVIHVDGARAMARHLSEGGLFDDLAGQHIVETSKHFVKLKEFVKYAMKNRLLNESNAGILESIKEKLVLIKENCRKLATSKQYDAVKEQFEKARLVELSDERVDSIKDQFTTKYFESTLEDALPLVSRILKEKEENEKALTEEIAKGVLVVKAPAINKAITFETKEAELAHFISETAKCVESEKVKGFLSKVSKKISENKRLDVFEQDTLKEIMSKMVSKKMVETTSAGSIASAAGGPARDPMKPIKRLVDETDPEKLVGGDDELTEWMPGDIGSDEWKKKLQDFLNLDCVPNSDRCRLRRGTAAMAKAALSRNPELSSKYDLEYDDASDNRVRIVSKAKTIPGRVSEPNKDPNPYGQKPQDKVEMPKTDPSKWTLESQMLLEAPDADKSLQAIIGQQLEFSPGEQLVIYDIDYSGNIVTIRFSTSKDLDGAEHLLIMHDVTCKENNGVYLATVGSVDVDSERFGGYDLDHKKADLGTFVAELAETGLISCIQNEVAPAIAAVGGAALRGAASAAAGHVASKLLGDD